jgi:hypothetical protein
MPEPEPKPEPKPEPSDEELLAALGEVLKQHKATCNDPNCKGCA